MALKGADRDFAPHARSGGKRGGAPPSCCLFVIQKDFFPEVGGLTASQVVKKLVTKFFKVAYMHTRILGMSGVVFLAPCPTDKLAMSLGVFFFGGWRVFS